MFVTINNSPRPLDKGITNVGKSQVSLWRAQRVRALVDQKKCVVITTLLQDDNTFFFCRRGDHSTVETRHNQSPARPIHTSCPQPPSTPTQIQT